MRALLRRPAFALTTILVLAFGIGANSALFSVVDAVLLKPLPYPDPDRIVQLLEANQAKNDRESLIAPVRLEDWNRLCLAFQSISGSYAENVTDTSRAEPERLAGRRVAPGFFGVYGMPPLLGRVFRPEEDKFGGPKTAVISEGLWTRRYNRNSGAIGQRLVLAGSGYTIVGVMPKEFASPAIEIWLPAQLDPDLMRIREARFYSGLGRLKPGVTIAQGRADLQRVQQRLGEQFPKTDKGWSVLVSDLKGQRLGATRRPLYVMFAAAALLLLIVCANVAGLMLGQLQRRERELAIRGSLGAKRMQIVGVVMREVAILGAGGGTLGLLLAVWGSRALSRLFADLPRMQEVRFDWKVVLFTTAVTAIAALIFGLTPALQITRRELNPVLARGGRAQLGGRLFQQILVSAQFTITVMLLAGAGLLLRSYYNLSRVQPGFSTADAITFHVGAEWGEDRGKLGLMQQQIVAQLEQLPGVRAAGITNFLPASGATLRQQISVEGLPGVGDDGQITVGTRSVTQGYLRALQIPLLQGATCPAFRVDRQGTSNVLVNRRFITAAGGANVVGRHISWGVSSGLPPAEIVGVVDDVKEDALSTPAVPYLYVCIRPGAWPDPEYVVAGFGGPRQIMNSVRQVVKNIASQRAVFGASTLAEAMDRALDQPRLNAQLLTVFALSALLSAAVGLYGLVMLAVTARTKEIGLRMALGAQPRQVLAHVLGEAGRSLGIALIVGAGVAMLALRAFRSMLYNVTPADGLTFASVCALLLVVAGLAAVIPGRRATKIDPLEALRSE